MNKALMLIGILLVLVSCSHTSPEYQTALYRKAEALKAKQELTAANEAFGAAVGKEAEELANFDSKPFVAAMEIKFTLPPLGELSSRLEKANDEVTIATAKIPKVSRLKADWEALSEKRRVYEIQLHEIDTLVKKYLRESQAKGDFSSDQDWLEIGYWVIDNSVSVSEQNELKNRMFDNNEKKLAIRHQASLAMMNLVDVGKKMELLKKKK